jgi:type I restriction enzyme S subunit
MLNSDGWPMISLGDVAEEITVGHVGPMASEYQPSGIPFLRSQSVEPFVIKAEGMRYISPEFHERLGKSALSPGDVVIVRTGKPGAAAVIPEWLPVSNCSDLVIVRTGGNLDSRFLVYYLNSAARRHISAHLVGAVQQHFNVASARSIKLYLPPLAEQKAIAQILGAVDNKIELNQRMNEMLEAMARAIFKSWFVDFDPVRAKAEGREPFGMDAATAALFPNSFQHSPLGKIPAGWIAGTIGDDFNLTMGQSPPGNTYNESAKGLPFFQGRTDFGFRYPVERVFCTSPTRFANPGDTLVSVRAPVGDINMALVRCAIGRGVAAVRHKSGSRSYTYYAVQTLREDFAMFEGEGTVFGAINKDGFLSIKIVIPNAAIIKEYEKVVSSLDQTIENNEKQSVTLTTIRDALLPKLVSGEIRVKDLEATVKRAI